MIQRLQTLILFLIIGLMLSLYYIPFLKVQVDSHGEYIVLSSMHTIKYNSIGDIVQIKNSPYIINYILSIIISIMACIEIFLFKKRSTQIKIGKLNNLLLVILTIIISYFTYKISIIGNNFILSNIRPGYLIILVCIYLNNKASYLIAKDEELVRSADRLR